MIKKLLVTGSSGLIGSEVCRYFASQDIEIHGIDNNQRAVFFGPQGDTRWNQTCLEKEIPKFHHHEIDIRNRESISQLIKTIQPQAIVHAAAQPSHDRAASIAFDDFDTNAVGTLNLLEACRQICLESPFVFLSTNKVYGDAVNYLNLAEKETRWDYADTEYANGIPETFSVDHSKHSLFGASKLAADILVQEYGRYFDMPTVCLRGGCLTGPNHSGVQLHGFLSYLIKCNLEEKPYTIFGYKGKQVRDNIHSLDVARFVHAFINKPKSAAVYNIGGGKDNSCSMLEAIASIEKITGKTMRYEYDDKARIGDHICYYSDLRKIQTDYPEWSITKILQTTLEEIVEGWPQRNHHSTTAELK